jgi:hypothetical protein
MESIMTRLGSSHLDGLDGNAGSADFGFPSAHLDASWTLPESGPQFYLRYQPSPHMVLDLETHAGIRKSIKKYQRRTVRRSSLLTQSLKPEKLMLGTRDRLRLVSTWRRGPGPDFAAQR